MSRLGKSAQESDECSIIDFVVLSADPGISGSLCAQTSSGVLDLISMPKFVLKRGRASRSHTDIAAVKRWMRYWKKRAVRCVFAVEAVNCNGQWSKIANWSLANNKGILDSVAECCGLRIVFIRPATWQVHHFGKSKHDKDRSRALAAKLFPNYEKSFKSKSSPQAHGAAEGALIGRYALEKRLKGRRLSRWVQFWMSKNTKPSKRKRRTATVRKQKSIPTY